jgi:hypothetical protein
MKFLTRRISLILLEILLILLVAGLLVAMWLPAWVDVPPMR